MSEQGGDVRLHHITGRVIERGKIFIDDRDGEYLINRLARCPLFESHDIDGIV